MTVLKTKIPIDTWVKATWDEYIQIIEEFESIDNKAKFYYYDGQLRIEMSPIGYNHAYDHTIITVAVSLFAALKAIPATGVDNCTYRKTGCQEVQPDLSYYIGVNANVVPWGTGIIDLDIYPPPDLVIEIANTSLADDLGKKRLLYEDLKIKEYWVFDVQNISIIAFAIEENGSKRINTSQVLPGLAISLLQEALQKTRQMNQSQVIAWLLTEFQK